MRFIRLTHLFNDELTLSDSKCFQQEYNNALKQGEIEVKKIMNKYYSSWEPEGKANDILINADYIEHCVKQCSRSKLISSKHIHLLPHITKIFLKGNIEYIVFEKTSDIQNLIEAALK